MIATTEVLTMTGLIELLVIPALLILLGLFIKQGREIASLKTAAESRPKNCFERGKWISKIDRRATDNSEHIAVLKSRMDTHEDLKH